jgi:hypothetical protein
MIGITAEFVITKESFVQDRRTHVLVEELIEWTAKQYAEVNNATVDVYHNGVLKHHEEAPK